MSANAKPGRAGDLWSWVESEKQLDRKVRRISSAAWLITCIAVVLYGLVVIARVAPIIQELTSRNVPRGTILGAVLETLVPLIYVVGVLSFLVALLSTIAVLLRFRTASLADIQTRIAAIENMLTDSSEK